MQVELNEQELEFLLKAMKDSSSFRLQKSCSRDFYWEEQYEKLIEKLSEANNKEKDHSY